MRIQFILTLCSISQAAYVSRMGNGNRVRAPTPFRPGVALHRTWTHPRVIQAASNRAPYILYRNPPHRFPTKQYPLPGRHLYKGPWKTTARLPQLSISTPEYDFMRAASARPTFHNDGGAIHTIPAPNLSLSEKPIVVLDTSVGIVSNAASDVSKATYEVTEKYPEAVYPMPKLERPAGFSKATSLSTPNLEALIGSGAPFQHSPDYGLSSINLHQSPAIHKQYTIQGFNGLPTQQDLTNTGAEGIIIPPNALYQSDPMFVQKLQSHLLQQFPAVEFIPYAADIPQIQVQASPSLQRQSIVLLEEEDLKQEPSSFAPSIEKNFVQRQTQENSFVEVMPAFIVRNVTEKSRLTTSPQHHNITVELVATDPKPITTTIKYIIENTTEENTTPIYYAQVGQSVGSLLAKSFYAAMNEATMNKAIEDTALAKEQKSETNLVGEVEASTPGITTTFTTTEVPEIKTTTELRTLDRVPFIKPVDDVNVSYTLFRVPDKAPKALHAMVRPENKEPKRVKDGEIYAGQIVEATISEDHDFNKQKATLLLKRAPIRLLALSNLNDITTEQPKATSKMSIAANVVPKVAVVKAKIPAKSKLTFDDKTGEPILRIYASYAPSLAHSKVLDNNIEREREAAPVTEATEDRKSSTVKSVDKTQGFEGNQVTQFGLKLRLRRDDYAPPFKQYDESV